MDEMYIRAVQRVEKMIRRTDLDLTRAAQRNRPEQPQLRQKMEELQYIQWVLINNTPYRGDLEQGRVRLK